MSASSSSSGGISLVTALTVTFVVLKALGKIDWSWWWVFSPVWLSVGLTLIVLLVIGIGLVIAWLVAK